MKRVVFGMLVMLSCIGTAQSQIPTTDVAHIAADAAGLISTLAEWGKEAASWAKQASDMAGQAKAWIKQGEDMKAEYDAITGIRSFGDLFNSPVLRNDMPSDWNSVYDSGKDMAAVGAEAGKIADMRGWSDKIKAAERLSGTMDSDIARVAQRASDMAVANKAVGQNAYAKQPGLMEQIKALMGQINQTTDAKSVWDLQARLAAEGAAQTAEQNSLLLMVQLQKSEEDLAREQRLGLSRSIIGNTSTAIPSLEELM